MARKDPSQEFWRRIKEERAARAREKKHHEQPPCSTDLSALMEGVRSADEATRAKAVRNLCPCRIGWEGFEQGMEVVDRMRKDPSPLVRGQALHVFQDAFEMQCRGLPTTPQMLSNEMVATRHQRRGAPDEADAEPLDGQDKDALKQARQRDRQLKRESTTAFGGRRGPR